MKLSIYTMRRTVYEGETSRVSLPTVTGEVTIMEHHEPYVTVLAPGVIRYEANRQPQLSDGTLGPIQKNEEQLPIKGGFLEMREGNTLRILADE